MSKMRAVRLLNLEPGTVFTDAMGDTAVVLSQDDTFLPGDRAGSMFCLVIAGSSTQPDGHPFIYRYDPTAEVLTDGRRVS